MQVIKKIIVIIFSLLCVVTILPHKANAISTTSIMEGADSFLSESEDTIIFDEKKERTAIDQVYFVMLTIGILVAIVVGTILGIQLITSSAAGKAKAKEKLIPFAIGAFVVFGAFGIWRVVYNALNGVLG